MRDEEYNWLYGDPYLQQQCDLKEDEEEHWKAIEENARYEDMLRWYNIEDSV